MIKYINNTKQFYISMLIVKIRLVNLHVLKINRISFTAQKDEFYKNPINTVLDFSG